MTWKEPEDIATTILAGAAIEIMVWFLMWLTEVRNGAENAAAAGMATPQKINGGSVQGPRESATLSGTATENLNVAGVGLGAEAGTVIQLVKGDHERRCLSESLFTCVVPFYDNHRCVGSGAKILYPLHLRKIYIIHQVTSLCYCAQSGAHWDYLVLSFFV